MQYILYGRRPKHSQLDLDQELNPVLLATARRLEATRDIATSLTIQSRYSLDIVSIQSRYSLAIQQLSHPPLNFAIVLSYDMCFTLSTRYFTKTFPSLNFLKMVLHHYVCSRQEANYRNYGSLHSEWSIYRTVTTCLVMSVVYSNIVLHQYVLFVSK